jgi:cysteine-rich repeat protein
LTLLAAGCGDDDGATCGDGVVEDSEQCDDGNTVAGDGCSADCLLEYFCGNGEVEVNEECDDGNDRGGDGCNSVCQLEVGCGNGRLDYGEECDDDNLQSGDGCSETCQDEDGVATCGNGILESGEGCDDGNTTAGDGCSADCQVEDGCGDGEEDPGEQCDDGNRTSGDGCSYLCLLEYVCGNTECETEGGESCEKCPRDCCPNCGNGILDTYEDEDPPPYEAEECDDGSNISGDGCSAGCQDEDGVATCGNGILETGEECDDGNTESGDSCNQACLWEFVCGDQACDVANGETCRLCPGDCCPNCGNNMIDAGENCDGNDLASYSCEDFCYEGGTLSCTSYCDFDLTQCTGTGPVCGDGLAECEERCDDTDLRGKDCNTLGYDGGTLSCDTDCTFDVSGCGDLLWYLFEDFNDAASVSAWTFGGDWEWGTPSGAGPSGCYLNSAGCVGTVMTGNYSNNASWGTDVADSPPIDLTTATAPALRFYGWISTEGSVYDGCNLKVSTDNGASYNIVSTVTPAYNLTSVDSQPAWGEDYESWNAQWFQFDADLSAFAGQIIRVRFDFRTDGSVNSYPGCYVDSVLLAEPSAMP